MVSLGGFSFDVDVNTQKGLASLDALVRRATTAKAELDRALSGSNPTINTSAAQQALGAVTVKAQQAQQAASFTATPKVDTKPAESALQKFGASVAQGIGFGGGAALAVKGIDALKAGLENSVGVGLKYNAQLETATTTLELFTGSASKAQDALKILRSYADFTPFNTDEVIQGGQAFISVVNGDIAAMEKLVRLSGQLAATNPNRSAGGGFESATIALREVLGGQTESIAERFNIPRSTIQNLKDAGLSGIELAEALVKAAHGSEELVQKLSETSTGKLSNFQSALQNLAKTATEPLFEELGKGLDALNTELSTNKEAWDAWAKDIGRAVGEAARDVLTLSREIKGVLDVLTDPEGLVGRLVTTPGSFSQGLVSQNPLLSALRSATEARMRAAAAASATPEAVAPGGTAGGPGAVSAARTSEQLKADAEKLGKELKEIDDDATRHALQNIDDHLKATRREAAEQKSAYEDARDAAIKAADATRDANIRALDDEAHARDRARTLEDRARAASQEAELRGLEAAHNANLKGLEEQATAIQKRHDEAVKGLDAEIRAVDQKRDAALRAIDDEQRAESRRHSEALRNIDAERDRRLGIIDQQLRALDAAALRDQRRQTDQSLQRALADAQRDRREADTPEERRRADRAVADARAAIQREAVNRQREDARAALRDQADQIRAAADAAKQIEDARNQGTTEGLSNRQRALNDQAKADTERLQAVKARVDEETRIEADSIKARIATENEGYQQTVQAARDSFEQINNAVADQRANEDAALASRRRSVQDTYDAAVDAARTAADGQIKELERQTEATTDNLDAQKRKWTEWKEHILGEIDAAMKAGDPEKLKRLQTSPDDSTFGPFDPAGYRQDSTYGPFDPAGYRDAAKAVGASTAEGLATGIGSPEAVAAATAATDKLIQDGVIDEAKSLLGIASPSTVFRQFGDDTAQGFLDGYQTVDLTGTIEKPFEDAITWMIGVPDHWRVAGEGAVNAFVNAYEPNTLSITIQSPFNDFFDERVPYFLSGFQNFGVAAAASFGAGYAARNVTVQFDQQINAWAAGVPPRFLMIGQASGIAMVRGIGDGLRQSFAVVQNVWYQDFDTLGSGLAISLSNGFYRYFIDHPLQSPSLSFGSAYPDESRILQRAGGGAFDAGQMLLVGEHGPEIVTFPQSGSVLPADTTQSMLASAGGGGLAVSGGGTSVQIGSMTIQVPAGTTDPRGYAQEIVMNIAQLISSANVSTRPGAPSSLIGA